MPGNTQFVNNTADASTSEETTLAAIDEILNRTDIRAKETIQRISALLFVDTRVRSKEDEAKRLAWVVWQKTNGRCTYCDEPLNPFDRNAWNGYHIDHVNPRAAGGTDDPDNLAPACARCNWSKQARSPEQWGAAQ